MYGTNAVESKAIPVLDKRIFQQYNLLHHGPVAQLGAHYIRIVGVGSSNLLGSTNKQSHPSGGFVYWYAGDSKILMELSGGQFPARPPEPLLTFTNLLGSYIACATHRVALFIGTQEIRKI